MIFVSVRAPRGTLLWRTVEEGNLLVDCCRRLVPGLQVWVFLLDHGHLGLTSRRDLPRVPVAMRAYALKRNLLRGEIGPAWRHRDLEWREETSRGGQRILLRYCSLNPCRKGHAYVDDPLAWPWSAHRDLTRLTLDPLVRPVRDPESYHDFVVSDPVFARFDTRGLPAAGPREAGAVEPREVIDAVASLLRVPPGVLRARGRPRRVVIAALRELCELSSREISDLVGISRSRVVRTPPLPPGQLEIVRRVLGDPRFRPWTDSHLVRLARRFHPDRR